MGRAIQMVVAAAVFLFAAQGLGCSGVGPQRAMLIREISSGSLSAEQLRARLAEEPRLTQSYEGECVLCVAIRTGRVDLVEVLLDAGEDPGAAEYWAFKLAIHMGAVEVVKLFLARGYVPASEVTSLVAYQIKEARVEHYGAGAVRLDLGGKGYRMCYGPGADQGCIELPWPTPGAIATAAKLAVEGGAYVSDSGRTRRISELGEVLSSRMEDEDREPIEGLVAALAATGPVVGVASGRASLSGESPLWKAVRNNSGSALRALLAAECPNPKSCFAANQTRSGRRSSLLHWAAQGNRDETVALLLRYGALPSSRNDARETPLHLVWSASRARLLLEAGAPVNARTGEGKTAMDVAPPAVHATLREFGGVPTQWVRTTCALVDYAAGEPQFRLEAVNNCHNQPYEPIRCHYQIRWACTRDGPLTHETSVWCPDSQLLKEQRQTCAELGSGKVRFDEKTGNYPAPNFCAGSPQTWRVHSWCEIRLLSSRCDAARDQWDGKACVPR